MTANLNVTRAIPVVVLASEEPTRAAAEAARYWAEERQAPNVLVWDVLLGAVPWAQWAQGEAGRRGANDPLTAVRALEEGGPGTVVIALNYHLFWKSPPVISALLDGARVWGEAGPRGNRRFIIVAPPGVSIPAELSRYIAVIDHRLPTPEELAQAARDVAEANELALDEEDAERLGVLGKGLTLYEFTNALALSIAEHGEIRRDVVADQKGQLVRKNAVLEIVRERWTFADIGGLHHVKRFLKATARHPLARGVLLLGVPGVGKTMAAKALGNEVGLPTLQLQFSRVFGSLVGESEQRLAAALKVVEALAPVVLIIDEIEKGLAGVQSSHRSDAGTAARVGEMFLTWLNDRPADGVYVVATCNDIDKLPPEFVRAERWDTIFFFDVPTAAERDEIARIYAEKYDVPQEPRPDGPGWTGAEIATAYRVAAMLGVDAREAARFTPPPLVVTMKEKIDALREWARGRCVPASLPQEDRAAQPAARAIM